MSEEALEAAEEGQETDQIDQPTEQLDQSTPEEDKPKGHISKAEWVEQGNNADDWRSPEVFKERGKWIGRVKELENQRVIDRQDTDSQIRNLNSLHQIQLAQTISDLEARRDNAIEEADTEGANNIQGQIDLARDAKRVADIPAPVPQVAPKSPEVMEWEARNPWVNNPNDPKTPYAQQQFGLYQAQGMDQVNALAAVEADVNRAFPNINPARNSAATGETPGGPGRKRSSPGSSITMKDLTHEETAIWKQVGPDSFGSEAEFLKAVVNSRKEA